MPHAALLLLALAAAPAAAQQTTITRDDLPGGVPAAVSDRVLDIFEAPSTLRLDGPAEIAAGQVVAGDVAALGGPVLVAGRVEGTLVVLRGDLEIAEGGEVAGDVLVLGGEARGLTAGAVRGTLLVYGEGFRHARADRQRDRDWDRDWDDEPEERERDREFGWSGGDGVARLTLRAGHAYNRVEGLPLRIGPVIRTAGSNPLRLEALAVLRTEAGDGLEASRIGYDLRAEQYLGGHRAFRLGAAAHSVVSPVEAWEVGEWESTLATLVLHEDLFDYFEREGWSAYAGITPPGVPLELVAGYRREDHGLVAPGDPWTLFGDDPWRLQPLVATGELRSVFAEATWDARDRRRDPTRGWFANAMFERGLDGSLALPAHISLAPPFAAVPAAPVDTEFSSGFLDFRGYHRVGRGSLLNVRAVLGGSLNGEPLPPQFQHALGGVGSLPGYDRFAADCGARAGRVQVPEDAGLVSFYPAYGCDRIALFQAEYVGDLEFDFELGPNDSRRARHHRRWDDWDEWWFDIDADLRWVVFGNAGQGWSDSPGRGGTDWLADAGLGILLGDLGLFWAVPLTEEGNGVNFFVRLGRRF